MSESVPVSSQRRFPLPDRPEVMGDGPEEGMTTAAAARALVGHLLQRCAGDTSGTRGDAQLAVTELIGNALDHGNGLTAFRADVDEAASRLWVEVEDASRRTPYAVELAEPGMVGGRGWAIVQRLATTLSVVLLPRGKRITVSFAL